MHTPSIAHHILAGDFENAEAAFLRGNTDGLRDEIIEAAFDRASILFYAFFCYLIRKQETAERHFLAAHLMSTALCHQPDGYQVAFYHMKKAVALDPDNVGYKMDMLRLRVCQGRQRLLKECEVPNRRRNMGEGYRRRERRGLPHSCR